MERYLSIYEVSQKQKYIFASNKLADCIYNSGVIAHVTDSLFLDKCVGDQTVFDAEKNLVYSGGGHIILEFPSLEQAKAAAAAVTGRVMKLCPEIEFFVRTVPYDEAKTPGQNVKALTAALERKKALRLSVFHQGSFGVEKTENGKPVRVSTEEMELDDTPETMPDGFTATAQFEKLGGTKGKANFIAVVHIDGNAMGKRVEELAEAPELAEWQVYKERMRAFSKGIAGDFRAAYEEMKETAARAYAAGRLEELSLKMGEEALYFPVRRVISEGDDMCFVTEGRIGIECAVTFLKALAGKRNAVDGKNYAACAGVAIVHQKYPFYRAYELAEELCSNAKRFGAKLSPETNGREISSIDWHIEYGEMPDSLEEIRTQYLTEDGRQLELRPYIVSAPEAVLKAEPVRQYRNFKKLMTAQLKQDEGYARGTLKELRFILKKGEKPTEYYLKFHQIESIKRDFYQGIYRQAEYEKTRVGSGELLERQIFAETADGKERCLVFDAIETMDTYLPLEEA